MPAFGVRSHHHQGCEDDRLEVLYSDLLTASAVGYARRLLLSVKMVHWVPSAVPFSVSPKTSVRVNRRTFRVICSDPPPSVLDFATVIVSSRRASRKSCSKPFRKPASASYSL